MSIKKNTDLCQGIAIRPEILDEILRQGGLEGIFTAMQGAYSILFGASHAHLDILYLDSL